MTKESEFLCHYTTLSGFKGIIESNALWATDLCFLNDKTELLHGLACAERAISFFDDHKYPQNWKESYRKVISEFKETGLTGTYTTCFCNSPDLLSQWRGYGGGQQGISIVFDKKQIIQFIELGQIIKTQSDMDPIQTNYEASCHPVIYTNVSSTAEIKESTDLMWLMFNDFFEPSDEVKNAPPNLINDFINFSISNIIPTFKNICFEEEDEFRIIIRRVSDSKNIKFRSDGKILIPFIILSNEKSIHPLPIKKVVIGPSKDEKFIIKSIRTFLDVNHYENVAIETSSIPYRT